MAILGAHVAAPHEKASASMAPARDKYATIKNIHNSIIDMNDFPDIFVKTRASLSVHRNVNIISAERWSYLAHDEREDPPLIIRTIIVCPETVKTICEEKFADPKFMGWLIPTPANDAE